MKISLRVFASILIFACIFLFACGKGGNGGKTDDIDVIDPMVIEVTENFINAYWSPDYNSFYCNNTKFFDFSHASGPLLGALSDFWWEAQNWETVMDIYERQGGEYYRELVDKVYDGFLYIYPHYTKNTYNDDIGWWAMGCTRAYKITGNLRFLDEAKEMFDYIYLNRTDELGGGIYWNSDRQGKNVCTNAPAAVTAARLSLLLNDQSYLEKAVSLFIFVKDNLYDSESGRLNDTYNINTTIYEGQFSYNYGTFALAAYEIYQATGDESYLDYTEKPLDYLLSAKLENGILKHEGNNDGAAFRTIFFRTLNIFAKTTRKDYQKIINDNALATYINRRESDKLCGYDWTKPSAEGEVIRSITAAASVSLMQYYKPEK